MRRTLMLVALLLVPLFSALPSHAQDGIGE